MNDYRRIEQAIRFLDEHRDGQPGLGEVAASAGLSESHFQRLFGRWAGISPKRYLQAATARRAKDLLEASRNVLDAAFGAGLSGPGRLHDLFVNVYAATPAQVRDGGAGLDVRYGFAPTPFGEALFGHTGRGLCALAFTEDRAAALGELRERWPGARLTRDDTAARACGERIFEASRRSQKEPLTLHLVGTNFQLRVWEALLRVPFGAATSYEDLGERAGVPGSARAVGAAVGANAVGYVIPCHRVLRASGALGGYRWGVDRKRTILAWETARTAGGDEAADLHS
ncbi:MAG TPA: methylated-DNA--[protein]-cysteine S-methyltransferase [Myxococcales bacterium]